MANDTTTLLINVVRAGQSLRATAVVDDDFPEMMHNFDSSLRAAVKALENDPPRQGFDLVAHLTRQREWSGKTFGPGSRTEGVLDHIRKELAEVAADPGDVTEWIDLVILAFDGAWRAGHEPRTIVDALVAKQARNEGRTWPDWRTADPTKAIEHDRSGEAPNPSDVLQSLAEAAGHEVDKPSFDQARAAMASTGYQCITCCDIGEVTNGGSFDVVPCPAVGCAARAAIYPDQEDLVPGEGSEAIEAVQAIAEQLRVPCTAEEIHDAIAELQKGGGTPTEFMRCLWLAIRAMGQEDGVTITKRQLIDTDWRFASLSIRPNDEDGSTVVRAVYREPDTGVDTSSPRCGKCGAVIKPDLLRGTICECTRTRDGGE